MVIFTKDHSVFVRWLGVAGLEFTFGDHTLLIDPFLSRPPLRNVFMGRVYPDLQLIKEKIKKADHILITHAQPADVLFLRSAASQNWYKMMIEVVQPRLVIPTHWDDLFRPLSQPVRPFFAPPTLNNPFIRRINLGDFKNRVNKADPTCKTLIPHVLQLYDLVTEMGQGIA